MSLFREPYSEAKLNHIQTVIKRREDGIDSWDALIEITYNGKIIRDYPLSLLLVDCPDYIDWKSFKKLLSELGVTGIKKTDLKCDFYTESQTKYIIDGITYKPVFKKNT